MSVQDEIRRVTAPDIRARKGGNPIVSLTSYHAHTARLVDRHCDFILVGDSLGMVMHGMESTVPVTLEMMILQGQAVMRGSKRALVVVDMPFGSYEASREQAFQSAARIMKETGCGAIKLEGGVRMAETIAFLSQRGIPVMGHVGLTPQTATALGGYKTQGKTARDAIKVCEDALALQAVGCFAIVFEAVPAAVTEAIVEKLEVPTIGIGAGPATAGQVLVFHDLLGITTGRMAKFVKRYADVHDEMVRGVGQYVDEVRSRHFPEPDHVYGVEPAELDELRRYLDQESLTSQKAWDWEPLP
jgi:3-methyl-2-oxobutanoate hydroxymethyltransferase